VIWVEGNVFTPGSPLPKRIDTSSDAVPHLLTKWVEDGLWETGDNIFITGSGGKGKTTAGLRAMRQVYRQGMRDCCYLTAQDFLNDIKAQWRFEEISQKLPRDDAVWAECMEWEREMMAIKECGLLFLDDLDAVYTPMHFYEINGLLRTRDAKALPTIVACNSAALDNLSVGVSSVCSRMIQVEV
jgi:hypothetical protein